MMSVDESCLVNKLDRDCIQQNGALSLVALGSPKNFVNRIREYLVKSAICIGQGPPIVDLHDTARQIIHQNK